MISGNRLVYPLDSHELAWAAGLFDGEGTVGSYKCNSSRIKVAMVDEESIRRFHRAVGGVGTVSGPYIRPSQAGGKWRPLYSYVASNFEAMQFVVAVLWHWLGIEKRAQARRALLEARNGKRALRLMAPAERAEYRRAQQRRNYTAAKRREKYERTGW